MLLFAGADGPVGSSNTHVCVKQWCLTEAHPLGSHTAWERMFLDHCVLVKQDALDWKEEKGKEQREGQRPGWDKEQTKEA